MLLGSGLLGLWHVLIRMAHDADLPRGWKQSGVIPESARGTEATTPLTFYVLYSTIPVAPIRRSGNGPGKLKVPRKRIVMHYEVEQKFALADPADMAARLSALGALAVGQCEQVDCYFSHPAQIFPRPTKPCAFAGSMDNRWSRIKARRSTARRKRVKRSNLHCRPARRPRRNFARLFVALGFLPVGEVRKRRQTFQLAWQGHEVEAALDEVVGLGDFVELEISATEATLDAARGALASLAARLDLATSERRSYLELLLDNSEGVRPRGVRPPSV